MGTQKEFIRYHLRNLLLANRRRISGRRKFFLGSVSRQVKLTPKKPDALEEIALLFVSSRNAPPHKEELCMTTSVEAGCGRCPDIQHILSGTWDQEKEHKMAPEICHVYSDPGLYGKSTGCIQLQQYGLNG